MRRISLIHCLLQVLQWTVLKIPFSSLLLFVCLLPMQLQSVAVGYFVGAIIDSQRDGTPIPLIGLSLFLLTMVVGSRCGDYLRRRVMLGYQRSLDEVVVDSLARQAPSRFLDKKIKTTLSQLYLQQYRIYRIFDHLIEATPLLVKSAVSIAVLYSASERACLLVIGAALFSALYMAKAVGMIESCEREGEKTRFKGERLRAVFSDHILLRDLQGWGKTGRMKERVLFQHDLFSRGVLLTYAKVARRGVLAGVVNVLSLAIALLWALEEYSLGSLSSGEMAFFIGALLSASAGFEALGNLVVKAREDLFVIRDVVAFLAEGEERFNQGEGVIHLLPSDPPTIEFRGVSFLYGDKKVLDGVSLTIRPGELLGVVGANGAGKSTFMHLLVGNYEPSEGVILVDGVPRQELPEGRWRELMSAVLQDSYLISGLTFRDNLSLSSAHSYPPLKFSRVLEATTASTFIEKLPQGTDTIFGSSWGGVGVSGGEEQMLMLSRGLHRNAPVLLVDEPCSAIDSNREENISRCFVEQKGSKTIVYITHRMGALRHADRIAVFREGKLTHLGTHAELMGGDSNFYKEEFERQASQFVRDSEGKVELAVGV